jgi:hypothetical protein
MKQSNIILGIGVLVAVILLVSSFFLKAEPTEKNDPQEPEQSLSLVGQKIKNIGFTPIRALTKHIIKIN